MQFWFRISAGGGTGNPGSKWFKAWNNAAGDRGQIDPSTDDAPAKYTKSPRFTWQGYSAI